MAAAAQMTGKDVSLIATPNAAGGMQIQACSVDIACSNNHVKNAIRRALPEISDQSEIQKRNFLNLTEAEKAPVIAKFNEYFPNAATTLDAGTMVGTTGIRDTVFFHDAEKKLVGFAAFEVDTRVRTDVEAGSVADQQYYKLWQTANAANSQVGNWVARINTENKPWNDIKQALQLGDRPLIFDKRGDPTDSKNIFSLYIHDPHSKQLLAKIDKYPDGNTAVDLVTRQDFPRIK